MEKSIAGRRKIDPHILRGDDVVALARWMLGKRLVTVVDHVKTSGIISETEAYSGDGDKASHASGGKITKRNKVMYEPGGAVYVYLCYGIHSMVNIVTNIKGNADAVLIRGITVEEGLQTILHRRQAQKYSDQITNGPGKVAQALAVSYRYSGILLDEPIADFHIWMEEGLPVKDDDIVVSKRIGVAYAGEDALKPWRFEIKKAHQPGEL